MKILELLLFALVVAVGIAWTARRIRKAVVRSRGQRVPTELTCPKRGSRVECVLVLDEKQGQYVGVDECSAFGNHARPLCTETCARLLNQGLPLGEERRSSAGRSGDEKPRVHLPLA